MSLNSFFTEPKPKQPFIKKENKKSTTSRKTRSEKRHNVKFPIAPQIHQLLRIAFKQAAQSFKRMNKKELTQTLFNTYLLKFTLSHLDIVDCNKPYKDTKRYMHTQPTLETDYREIGGPYGLSTKSNCPTVK